jgi:hypothetical protein
MTLLDTFERVFRERLLDLLYGQWGILGAPFSDRGSPGEVIDPEALLWCSLEFLPTEPRLSEAVRDWIRANEPYLVRQRLYKIRDRHDPRAIIWRALDDNARAPEVELGAITEPCHGLVSPSEVVAFAHSIEAVAIPKHPAPSRLGRPADGPATLLLKARDFLGHDIRHFLLVYLLALPHGGKLRDVRAWSGHAYRSLSDAADRWEAAGIVSFNTGFCRLIPQKPFRTLLKIRSERIVLVNWLKVFDISVRLLRDLAKARVKGFAADSTIQDSLRQEALEKLVTLSCALGTARETSVALLLKGLPIPR